MTVKALSLSIFLAFPFRIGQRLSGMKAGQTVAATIPAFMMVDIGGQRLWTDLRSHYWEATLILLVGGLIGVQRDCGQRRRRYRQNSLRTCREYRSKDRRSHL